MTTMKSVFGADGALSRVIPGYVPRKGQIEMSEAVASKIANGGALLLEAPTGVGKSAGVLAPILASGKVALVVTANIALSEQYTQKDFPLIAGAMGMKNATCALAKGLSNYLCLDALEDNDEYGEEISAIEAWSEKTVTGDISELSFVPGPRTLRAITRSSDDCLRKACPSFEGCFALAARKRAKNAQVVVTNYHMLFSHLEILATGAPDGILPHADVLILDEAHKMAEIARGFVGMQISEAGMKRALGPLAPSRAAKHARPALDPQLARRALDQAAILFAGLRPGRLKKQGGIPGAEPMAGYLVRAASIYGEAIRAATDIRDIDGAIFGPTPPRSLQKWYAKHSTKEEKKASAWVERLRVCGRSCVRYAQAIRAADALTDKDHFVYFVEISDRGAPKLTSSPIEVGPYLERMIWSGPLRAADGPEEDRYDTVVAMSATLRDGGNSFDLVVNETGARGVETLAVESPFDFSRCMVVTDGDWPEPKEPTFGAHLAEKLETTIKIAGGRTLALFASWRALEATYERISSRRAFGHIPKVQLLKQGTAPRTALVRMFKEDETSVLFGVESFWAGVDVPGRALSAVFIEKIPFATPDDPILDALSEKLGREAFSKYSLPRAVIQFRQGFGRLIRTMSDAGIVVIADPRVLSASYGKRFTGVLPKDCIGGDFHDAKEHLDAYLKEAS